MSYDYQPRLREDHKPIIDKRYIMARYICPVCNLRYGTPDPLGIMDLRRCDKCPRFSHDKITISKRKLKCNQELMQIEGLNTKINEDIE